MPDRRWLVLRLEAPMLAFGGVAIDQMGVTRDFPAASMLTGLLANALGYTRDQWQRHQALQDRLVFAARLDREAPLGVLTDTQNAELTSRDKGWTTRGRPEGRAGGSLGARHRRWRDYHPDALVHVALRLEPEADAPDLDTLRTALERPARPLFIGRKPCLPAAPVLFSANLMAPDPCTALMRIPRDPADGDRPRALWPADDGPANDRAEVERVVELADLRNWRSGLHGGTRRVAEGRLSVEVAP